MSDEIDGARAAKRALRRRVRERIGAIDPADRIVYDRALVARATTLHGFNTARTVLLYAKAFGEEIETRELLAEVLAAGQRLILPRVSRDGSRLDLAEVRDLRLDLERGTLAIPEPAEHCAIVDVAIVDWLLVPGLAFDVECNRLGRGAGHYDRLLARARGDAPKWAIAYDEQCFEHIPTESHDQKITGVITPTRLISAVKKTARESSI